MKLVSYNCNSIRNNTENVKNLLYKNDVVFLQEIMLSKSDLPLLFHYNCDASQVDFLQEDLWITPERAEAEVKGRHPSGVNKNPDICERYMTDFSIQELLEMNEEYNSYDSARFYHIQKATEAGQGYVGFYQLKSRKSPRVTEGRKLGNLNTYPAKGTNWLWVP